MDVGPDCKAGTLSQHKGARSVMMWSQKLVNVNWVEADAGATCAAGLSNAL